MVNSISRANKDSYQKRFSTMYEAIKNDAFNCTVKKFAKHTNFIIQTGLRFNKIQECSLNRTSVKYVKTAQQKRMFNCSCSFLYHIQDNSISL